MAIAGTGWLYPAMFNLLVSYSPDSWKQGVYEFDHSRVFEYTEDSVDERYRDLKPEVIKEQKIFPTLFCVEGEEVPSRVGYITDIKLKESKVRIAFEFDPKAKVIRRGKLAKASVLLELGRYELTRTHWAVKEGDLWSILAQLSPQVKKTATPSPSAMAVPSEQPPPDSSKQQVFIVHGHDEIAKYEMADELRALGCEPIILHEQASSGMTVIEKIEHYSNVGFAVVLLYPV
jgi:hypothetical protein